MPADALLNTLLTHLHTPPCDPARVDQLLSTAVHLLRTLTNPLNLSVLTSQLLQAPALWDYTPQGTVGTGPGSHQPAFVATTSLPLATSLRMLSVYNSAATRVRTDRAPPSAVAGAATFPNGETQRAIAMLSCDDWARGIVAGADDRSPRWKHLLVLAGVLMGMEAARGTSDAILLNSHQGLSMSVRSLLEESIIGAANLALSELPTQPPHAGAAVVLALSYVLPLLSEAHASLLDCNSLLPVAIRGITLEYGFHGGLFLRAVDADLQQAAPHNHQIINWTTSSPGFQTLNAVINSPLMAGLGPAAKLIAYAVRHTRDPAAVIHAQGALLEFTSTLHGQWQASPRLAGIDPSTETNILSLDTRKTTWPALWGFLQKGLFATVSILQAVVARTIRSRHFAGDAINLAENTLHTLRNMHFISSRQGNSQFEAYTFTYLTSIDILSQFPDRCTSLLGALRPPFPPSTLPHQRSLDLFYLNLAEHLPLSLDADACATLIAHPAMAYLDPALSPAASTELFEAAHAAILAVMLCPQTSALTSALVPNYADGLFAAFPLRVSPRQFRLAFCTLAQVAAPPTDPLAPRTNLSEALLEMARMRILDPRVGTAPLPVQASPVATAAAAAVPPLPMSEQSALALALIDTLPHLPVARVEAWLNEAAGLLGCIADGGLREPARRRLWEILANGEMDAQRAAVCVRWWGAGGGMEMVMGGAGEFVSRL